jgi:hypothetical protein
MSQGMHEPEQWTGQAVRREISEAKDTQPQKLSSQTTIYLSRSCKQAPHRT